MKDLIIIGAGNVGGFLALNQNLFEGNLVSITASSQRVRRDRSLQEPENRHSDQYLDFD